VIAGLPGTGIGGLFYLLLTALMPLRHAVSAVRRRSRAGAGRVVLRCVALAAGIVATIWAQAWALRAAILALSPAGQVPAAFRGLADAGTSTYVKVAAFASLASLAAVVLTVHALRLFLRRREAPAVPALPEAAPVEALPARAMRRAG
jgi:hypothetical protein